MSKTETAAATETRQFSDVRIFLLATHPAYKGMTLAALKELFPDSKMKQAKTALPCVWRGRLSEARKWSKLQPK